MKLKIILIYFVFLGLAVAQKPNPEEILKKVKTEFEKINDYTADLYVKLDINYIQIPDVRAKIYFKKPNKMHVESSNFAILPKQGLNLNPLGFLEKEYTAIYENLQEIKGENFHKIKIIPKDTEKGPSLITVLINSKNFTICRVTTLGEKQGKVDIEFEQMFVENKFWLPKKITVTADIGNFKDRKKRHEDSQNLTNKNNEETPKSGKVYINYSNYIVNKGIDDKIFINKKTK